MTKARISFDWRYKFSLVDLIYLAETNFLVCEKVYKEIVQSGKHPASYDFLLLAANTAFYDSIEIVHTLLCSKKKEELIILPFLEQTIEDEKALVLTIDDQTVSEFKQRIFNDFPHADFLTFTFLYKDRREIGGKLEEINKKIRRDTGLKDLKELKEKFEKSNFHKIRHQTVAHKNKELVDPAGASHLLLRENLIEDLGKIIRELRINAFFWFGHALENPNFPVLRSLDKILNP